jgi:hypothetical protein
MKIVIIAAALTVLGASVAYSQGLMMFGVGQSGTSGAAATNRILLVDATSLLLQTDGASHICLAGGC